MYFLLYRERILYTKVLHKHSIIQPMLEERNKFRFSNSDNNAGDMTIYRAGSSKCYYNWHLVIVNIVMFNGR